MYSCIGIIQRSISIKNIILEYFEYFLYYYLLCFCFGLFSIQQLSITYMLCTSIFSTFTSPSLIYMQKEKKVILFFIIRVYLLCIHIYGCLYMYVVNVCMDVYIYVGMYVFMYVFIYLYYSSFSLDR